MKWFRHTHDRPRKILLLSKRWLAIPGALLCVCALCLVTTLPAYVTASAPQRQLPVYCVQRDYKVCSLTFDAAWGNEDTQQLIDILGRYHVKATFFVVGDWVEKYPESVKALSDAGHEVMSHSDHHDHPRRSPPTSPPATTRSRPSPGCGPPSSGPPMGSTTTT